MKKALTAALVLSVLILAACNNNSTKTEAAAGNTKSTGNDTLKQAATPADTNVQVVTPTFTNVDPKASTLVKTIIGHYLHLKNALANDNGSEAADAGKEMVGTMDKADKSLFTAEQKKVYDAGEESLKEDAEHIGRNSGKIEHQREHFANMSEDIYALAKAFGGGQTLYNDFCPMYKDKGVMWISESVDIKNPYMGSKMLTCGEVKEKIQ